MLTYLSLYNILVCRDHRRAIYRVDEHLQRYHKLPNHMVRCRFCASAHPGAALAQADWLAHRRWVRTRVRRSGPHSRDAR